MRGAAFVAHKHIFSIQIKFYSQKIFYNIGVSDLKSFIMCFSGPKRYDFMDNTWIYKRDGIILHDLLTDEISKALQNHLDFTKCTYGRRVLNR